MAIAIGNACDDRASSSSSGHTIVDQNVGASDAGSVDTICVFVALDMSGVEFGVFTDNGGNSLTCQAGHHCSGANLSPTVVGSPVTYTAGVDYTAFNTDSGEYLGIYFTGGQLEKVNAGVGYWIEANSDEISDDNTEEFASTVTRTISLGATGTEGNGAVAPTGALYGPLVGPMGGPI